MLDFIKIKTRCPKGGVTEVYPEFIVKSSSDLMIKGNRFYAIWDEEAGFWSTDQDDVRRLIDNAVMEKYNSIKDSSNDKVVPILLSNFSTKKWSEWLLYSKSLPDNFHDLDSNIYFLNSKIKKTNYASKTAEYSIEDEPIEAYEELVNVLYDPEERQKFEWAVGSIISGASKKIQKFLVFYGGPGTGKSTILNIIQDLFKGYYTVFESKALSSNSDAFALASFKDNPLIAIQHDGDLSRIEDNTKLNSIVSHEEMQINEKFKAAYPCKINSLLFMGTNKPVKITDAKSGILRRLIDVNPTGNKVPPAKYDELMNKIHFELGGIAQHCLDVYKKCGSKYYNTYEPTSMMSSTNDFFNFIEDNYEFFSKPEGVTLKESWLRYKDYCEDAGVMYKLPKRIFKDELKNYYETFTERGAVGRNVYTDFIKEKFEYGANEYVFEPLVVNDNWINLESISSLLDEELKDCPAQYASDETETPTKSWDKCKTTLKDIDTSKVHYVRVPENLIVIDFDLRDDDGNKSLEKNIEAASKWPPTYVETSKSGGGLHLHYYYDGDITALSRIYDENIEVKVYTGKSSLRRKLLLCNTIAIATINSGLPLKEVKNVVTSEKINSEKSLINLIERNLRKEIHPYTKPSMDFIYQILEEAYESGLHYDVTFMRPDIQVFALRSTNNADYCLRLIDKMHFCSDEPSDNVEAYGDNEPIVFFDIEIFPNLFVICWKIQSPEDEFSPYDKSSVVRMINPTSEEVEKLLKYRLVGYNNRNYDNHLVWAKCMGYTELELYKLSKAIIKEKDKNAKFGEAYNLSYTDIYDYSSKKQSLKKWEIELGIHHQELDMDWDQPVPEDKWMKVADYCCNDVLATEATFNATKEDFLCREILADISGLTVNDTTNSCTTRIIVGKDKNPQSEFIYTDLSTIFPGYEFSPYGIDKSKYKEGTKIVSGKSIYKGEDPGEGGRVYANTGMYTKVGLFDIASQHPHSAIALKVFGKYTKNFEELVEARICVKHGDIEKAGTLLEGKLTKWLNDPRIKLKSLAYALKIAINSVYGLTSANFPNKLKDPRNVDNIVAKYGALFMMNLTEEVEKRGYTVVHVKTDSIKVANYDEDIKKFIMEYGKKYGFTFEHEATYSKMCLVNESTYIAEVSEEDEKTLEKRYWTATGTQFQVPYVFKTLFSKEPIELEDMCETKSVTTSMYLDMNENLGEDEHNYIYVGKVGQFCPILPGNGAGLLVRKNERTGKYDAVVGTKKKKGKGVHRWMESEVVRNLHLEDKIDKSYYNNLVDEAIEKISTFGDFERFVTDSGDMSWLDVPEDAVDEMIPFL